MSTFDGSIREIPGLKVDFFSLNTSHTFFLSHCHQDHMRGLDNPSFCSTIYCSEVTGRMLPFVKTGKYEHLQSNIKYIPMFESIAIRTHQGDCVLVTAFPANHCAGSTMFLFEFKGRRVLYTGDLRVDDSLMSDILSTSDVFCNSFGSVKQIDTVYIDTTFCDKKLRVFPSKNQSLAALLTAISSRSSTATFSLNFLSLGYEHLVVGIANRFQTKIHVSHEQYALYASFSSTHPSPPDENMLKYVTKNPSGTRFHFRCDCWKTDKSMIRLRATTMPWCESLSQYLSSKSTSPDNQETLDPGFSICEETASMIHVFFAMHSSYNELRNLIRVIKPHTVHACVLDTSSPWNNAETLCAFDDLLGSRKSSSAIPLPRNRSSGEAAAIQRGKSVAELLLEDLLNGKVPHAETSSAEMESTCEMEDATQSLDITQPLDLGVEEFGSSVLVVSAASEEVKKDSSGNADAGVLKAVEVHVISSVETEPLVCASAEISSSVEPVEMDPSIYSSAEPLSQSDSGDHTSDCEYMERPIHASSNEFNGEEGEPIENADCEEVLVHDSLPNTFYPKTETYQSDIFEDGTSISHSEDAGLADGTSIRSKDSAIVGRTSSQLEECVITDSELLCTTPQKQQPVQEDDFDDSILIIDLDCEDRESLCSSVPRRSSIVTGFSESDEYDSSTETDVINLITPRKEKSCTPKRNPSRDPPKSPESPNFIADSPILSTPVKKPTAVPKAIEIIDLTMSSDDDEQEEAGKRLTLVVPDSQESTPVKITTPFLISAASTPIQSQPPPRLEQNNSNLSRTVQKQSKRSVSPFDSVTAPLSAALVPPSKKQRVQQRKSASGSSDSLAWIRDLSRRNSSVVHLERQETLEAATLSNQDVLEKRKHIEAGGEFVLECTYPFKREKAVNTKFK